MTIVTPSAKSHERVTGRWVRDLDVKTTREWSVYYIKVAIGSPIPWLMWSYVCLAFLSRAGLEIAAWASAILTLIYVIADRFSKPREFHFFRIGCDLFLLGYVAVAIVSACSTSSMGEAVATLGGVRWVLLLYLIAYCWELFPGLNRVFGLMVGMGIVAGGYGVWQHFTGIDLLTGHDLGAAPTPGSIYFLPIGFFNTPECFGTLLSMTLAFPIAAFLFADNHTSRPIRWVSLLSVLFLALVILWTYRAGMWLSGLTTLVVVVLMQARRAIILLATLAAFIAVVLLVTYSSTDAMLTSVQASEFQRAAHQRQQINTQVELWQQSPWFGVGRQALDAANYDPGTGNVYFQVLAQSGVLGLGFYFLFVLGYLLATYRIFQEVPSSHYWHRVLISGALASQIAFHVAGLYWSTLSEALIVDIFVLVVSAVGYLSQHYSQGLVPDDYSL